jgi:hypothetical protein
MKGRLCSNFLAFRSCAVLTETTALHENEVSRISVLLAPHALLLPAAASRAAVVRVGAAMHVQKLKNVILAVADHACKVNTSG